MSIVLPEAAGQARSTKSEPPLTAANVSLTLESVQTKIKEIEANQRLEESRKNQLLELYRQAQSHLEAAEAHTASALAYKQAVQSAPAEIEKLHRTSEQPEEVGIAPSPAADTPFPDLERQLLEAQADLAGLRSKRGELETQIHELHGRTPAEIQNEIAAAKQALEIIDKDLKANAGLQESPLLVEANTVVLQVQREARTAEIQKLEQELLSHDVRVELLIAQREEINQELTRAQTEVNQIEEITASRRQTEVERAQLEAETARREAAGKHPAMRKLADQNAALSRELAAIVQDLDKTTAEVEHTSKQLEQLEHEF